MILKGNCLDTLKTLPDCSVDSIVTDPPYELGFMGKSWDNSGIAYNQDLWAECLRVLKPGGHLLAFSGSRTYHRMVVAIEDSGFEIRDQIMYLYGSGFPKSLDVSKAIDKGSGENLQRQLRFTEWMRSTGITAKQIDEATGTHMGGHYLSENSQPTIATANLFDKLRYLLPEVPEEIERLVAERTGIEWTAYKNREVVGTKPSSLGGTVGAGERNQEYIDYHKNKIVDITAPATPEAQQWDGWGTALKPAHEPIVVARKPLIGTVAQNVLTYGTGAINIDESRVGTSGENFDDLKGRPITKLATRREGETDEEYRSRVLESPSQQKALAKLKELGRWPANVIHDGSDEVLAGFPNSKGGAYPAKRGQSVNAFSFGGQETPGGRRAMGDDGSAARFFKSAPIDEADTQSFIYCAKASKSERNAGLEGLPERGKVFNGQSDKPASKAEGSVEDKFSPKPAQNFHPTVKPLALMRYLIKLVTPPGGTVLDPFLGSGTTAVAAILEGFEWIGCEMTEDYFPIIEARVEWAENQPKTLI